MKKPWELDPDRAEENESASSSAEKGAPKKEARETDPLLADGSGSLWQQAQDGFGFFSFILELERHFGYKLMVLLFVCQHLLKGFANTFTLQAVPYLYAKYKVPAPQVQIFNGMTQLPWSMKPIIGLLSDVLPIFGYNKAPYMIITALLGASAVLYVGLVPTSVLPVILVVCGLFLLSLQFSTCDLLSEAKYAEKMATAPSHGPGLLTYVWAGLSVGGIVALLLSGFTISKFGPQAVFCIAAVPVLMLFIPVGCGYLEEKQVTSEELQKARSSFYKQKEACMLCVLMLVGSLSIIGVGLRFASPAINCAVSVSVALVMLLAFSMVLSPVIAKFNAFSLVQAGLSLSISGATFYFYTDTPEKYKDGPHFTPYFFNSVMGTLGQVMSLFGIILYQKYFSTWKYRHLLLFTNIVNTLLCVLDVAMFARLNKRVGIPDHYFVLGLSVFETIIQQWMWMPQVVILSFLCPKGMEATMYALLAGCHNLGNTIALNSGALLLQVFGCRPDGSDGEDAQFDNLWKAAAVASAFPMLSLLALYRLIPDAYQNERLVGDKTSDATAGSLWRRWTDS
mmetsp:Transcript_42878/g.100605  ORF Transcript_42878/g.100605 Transcript_42878/m.100605 type:complete len:566 (+) Transcript_42878:176-1873(+)